MALFSFGKKDKKPPEVAVPVTKTQPTPPKIQTPPTSVSFPAVKPPQPTGLMPSVMPAGVATTQPMAVPRTGSMGLKPSRPGVGQSTRSTQRIVLPTPPGAKANNTKSLTMGTANGRINLPIGMILRCLPPEVLAGEISEFEATGAAATEIGLPMNLILGQLPSGKVEMTLQDLVPHFPPGFLQPTGSIANYLPNIINLPLMDVVMRIPPDLLALRPDQKDVDAAVINMADPFTEEILREQAEAARRQGQTKIIDESQVPQEEFVPRDQASLLKSVAPPRRPTADPLAPSRVAATTLATPPPMPPIHAPTTKLPSPAPTPVSASLPPMPAPTTRLSNPTTTPGASQRISPVIPRPASTSQPITIPVRSTTTLPPRPVVAKAETPQPPVITSTAPVPPVPRHTGPIPAPPPPRHTTSLPGVPRRTSSLASLSQSMRAGLASQTPRPSIVEAPPAPRIPTKAAAPDAGADDLQRLAALAMAQMGESTETPAEASPAPEPEAQTEPAPTPDKASYAPLAAEVAAATAAVVGTAALVEHETTPLPEPAPVEEPAAVVEEPVSKIEESAPVAEETAPVVHEPEVEPALSAETSPALEPAPAAEATPEVAPEPLVEAAPAVEPEPVAREAVSAPVPAPEPEVTTTSETEVKAEPEVATPSAVAFNLNTCTADDLVKNIPDCSLSLAESIIAYRTKIGSFKKIEDLLDVPGITKAAYTNLTGEAPPDNRISLTLNELLGYPPEQHISLKDVTDRIACWPDVTGCLLSQSTGLSLVGTVPAGLDKAAIVAFAPRMFESINKSFLELSGQETDAIVIPSSGTSFHLFRNRDLYLIIMSRLPLMPERHTKVARFVLAALSTRKD